MSYYVTQARTRARYNIYSVVSRVTNGRVSRLGPSEILVFSFLFLFR